LLQPEGEPKPPLLNIVYNITKPLEELLNFPHKSDSHAETPAPEDGKGAPKVEYRYNQLTKEIEPIEPLPDVGDQSR
jgi:hypothetical protein